MGDLLKRLQSALAGRYTIVRELGHGGMATVYVAEDLKHHRQVALKVLRPELLSLTAGSIPRNAHRPARGPGGVRLVGAVARRWLSQADHCPEREYSEQPLHRHLLST
jgi:serine/threonine protein kinase